MDVSYKVCDIDEEDSRREAERREIVLDGQRYEIDLCYQHNGELDQMAQQWIAHARKAAPTRPGHGRTQADRDRSKRIRAWAKANDMDVPERGRLDQAVITGYYAEHPADRPVRAV